MRKKMWYILVCNSANPKLKGVGCCSERGSDDLIQTFRDFVAAEQQEAHFTIKPTPCLSNCGNGISVRMLDDMTLYGRVAPSDVAEIITSHCYKNQPIKRLMMEDGGKSFLD
ncbi:MAG: (2Fe-2S) ferredoxin domain-containing protein [Bacteroidia bacterium]|nr:(2Fe-2S) ferredoxin domain-containing protein [Bacteroidia bacterium]